MIIYFCDKFLTVQGLAGSDLSEGLTISNDLRTDELETGTTTFECDVHYTEETHQQAKSLASVGNYILSETADGRQSLYAIIETEDSTEDARITVYGEDDGMELIQYFSRKETHMIDKFLTSNATTYRLARTILQGIIAVVIANLDVLFGFAHMSGSTKAFVVALTMAVLSPIMGALSSNGKTIEAYSGGIPDEAKEATGETEVEEDPEG